MEAIFEYLNYNQESDTFQHVYHQHACYELIYFLSGEGASNIDGTDYSFKQNTYTLMPMNSLHNRINSKKTEFLAIGFLFNPPNQIKGGVYPDVDGKILAYLMEIKEEFQNRQKHFHLRLNTLVLNIVIEIDRLLDPSKNQPDFNAFIYIKNYIDLYYNEKIDFNALAKLSFYSYDHFRYKFKEFTGHSPYQYLLLKRIDNAKEMLVETDNSITQIAMDCGFTTTPQFCCLFKNYVSQTPLKFRKLYQQEPKKKYLSLLNLKFQGKV
jgi:AraC-like DNA-binding protein